MLRLKSKTEATQVAEDLRAGLIEERNRLTVDVSELTKRKNQAILDLKQAEDSHESRLAALDAEYASKKSVLLNEVLSLEARQREALKPTKERELAVAEKEKNLTEAYENLTQERKSLDEDLSLLAEKVAEASDRLSEARSAEKLAERKLANVREAEEVNRKSTESLSLKWLEYRTAFQERENQISLRENELTRKESEFQKEKEWHRDQRDWIAAEKRSLESQRASLEDAIRRTKQKGDL